MKLRSETLHSAEDGRNIAPDLGVLEGEGSQQEIQPLRAHPGRRVLAAPASEAGGTTYYGLPIIKEPVWIWTVPAYFFVGGLAGASNLLGAVCQAVNLRELEPVVVRARWIGAIGDAASAVLLISDLGRPTRFLNMLRVFRPTSPMSVGSWILAVCGGLSAASALLAQRSGVLGTLGNAANYGSGLMGVPLAGYTGVLLGNTAVPVWQASRRSLPVLFMASATASAASVMELLALEGRPAEAVRRFGIAGKTLELAASVFVEREAREVRRVGLPLRSGLPGVLWNASRVLTVASLATAFVAPRRRWARMLAGVLGTAGAITLRFAVVRAGKASARDPRATFDPQRARLQPAGAAPAGPRESGTLPHEEAPGIEAPSPTA